LENKCSVRLRNNSFAAKSAAASYVPEYRKAGDTTFMHNRKFDHHKIFTTEGETELSNYLLMSAKLHHGFTAVETHKL
jgi:hypothetical protein